MKRKRLGLIDLDTILFIIAYNQFTNGNKDNPELIISHVKEYINTILINSKIDLFSMVFQDRGHSNYRKYFYPDYKSKRPPEPEFITIWKDKIIEVFKSLGAISTKIIEADDVINIGYNRFKEEYTIVIISADKDLNQIPGEHYNPKKHITYFVTEEEALHNLFVQILMGDSTDNITAIPGIGKVKAEKILANPNFDSVRNMHKAYMDYFGDTWYSEYTKTKFLVTLLTEINYNIYPLSQEVTELFNIKKVTELVTLNLFE